MFKVVMLTVVLLLVFRYDGWTCEVCYHTNDIAQPECVLCSSSQNGESLLNNNAVS